jgi:hypothetical protein
MTKFLFVNTTRKGVPHLTNEPIQLDNISPIVIAGAGGAIPYNSYMLYSLQGVPDIVNGDLLFDTKSSDQYRVSGNEETFDGDHLEVMVEKTVVKTP